jgi:hypothetical protein
MCTGTLLAPGDSCRDDSHSSESRRGHLVLGSVVDVQFERRLPPMFFSVLNAGGEAYS